MSSDFTPSGWVPEEDELAPLTEPKGELTPPPRKPPTAVSGAVSGPEPRPPRPSRVWDRPAQAPRFPSPVVQAVDAVLDVLDAIGDSVRATADRLTR